MEVTALLKNFNLDTLLLMPNKLKESVAIDLESQGSCTYLHGSTGYLK